MATPTNPGPFFCFPIRVSCLTYPFDLPPTLEASLTYTYVNWPHGTIAGGDVITVMNQVSGNLPQPYQCNNAPCQTSLSTFPAPCVGGTFTAPVPLTKVGLPFGLVGLVPPNLFLAAYVNSAADYYGGSFAQVWNNWSQNGPPNSYCIPWYKFDGVTYPIIDAQGYQAIPSPLAGCTRNTYALPGCVMEQNSCPLPSASSSLPPVMSFGDNIGVAVCLIVMNDANTVGCLLNTYIYLIDLQSTITTYQYLPICTSQPCQPSPTKTCLVAPFTGYLPSSQRILLSTSAFVGGETELETQAPVTNTLCVLPSPPPPPPPLSPCPGPDTTGNPEICRQYTFEMGAAGINGINPTFDSLQASGLSTDLNSAWEPNFPRGQCGVKLPRDLTLTLLSACEPLTGSYPLTWAGGDAFDVPTWEWTGIVNNYVVLFTFTIGGTLASPFSSLSLNYTGGQFGGLSTVTTVDPLTAEGSAELFEQGNFYSFDWTVTE